LAHKYFSIAFSLNAHPCCFYAIFILDSSQPIRLTQKTASKSHFELASIHRHHQLLGDCILSVRLNQAWSL
jgi:hypothetical protein